MGKHLGVFDDKKYQQQYRVSFMKNYMRVYRKKLKEENKCQRCCEKVKTGHVNCISCRIKTSIKYKNKKLRDSQKI